MEDFFEYLAEVFRHHRVVDDPEPWEPQPPEGFVTPSIMKHVIEQKLRSLHGIVGELPIEVKCRLSPDVNLIGVIPHRGIVGVEFVERATRRQLRTLEEVHAVLSQHGIM